MFSFALILWAQPQQPSVTYALKYNFFIIFYYTKTSPFISGMSIRKQ